MPKDELDPEDPMELCGVGIATEEDTTEAMTECFIEEFMRLGYNHERILALFCNPHYTGMSLVMRSRGEAFVREHITETFAKWGRSITWLETMRHNAALIEDRSSGGDASLSRGNSDEASAELPTDPDLSL